MFVIFRTKLLCRRALRCERGYTLIEALIVSVLTVVVVSATLSVLESGQRTQARDSEYALAIQEGRVGMARMTHEIRQAYSILGTTSSSIHFNATIGGVDEQIEYNCNEPQTGTSYLECVRKEAAVGAALPSTGSPIIKNVLNGTSAEKESIFVEYSPNAIAPDLVTVRVVLPASGTLKAGEGLTHHLVLTTTAYIHDMNIGA